MTTNGVLLKKFAAEIKDCGVHRINISLDSLKPERFSNITGHNYFEQVWDGIQEAERLEFNPIKINTIPNVLFRISFGSVAANCEPIKLKIKKHIIIITAAF